MIRRPLPVVLRQGSAMACSSCRLSPHGPEIRPRRGIQTKHMAPSSKLRETFSRRFVWEVASVIW